MCLVCWYVVSSKHGALSTSRLRSLPVLNLKFFSWASCHSNQLVYWSSTTLTVSWNEVAVCVLYLILSSSAFCFVSLELDEHHISRSCECCTQPITDCGQWDVSSVRSRHLAGREHWSIIGAESTHITRGMDYTEGWQVEFQTTVVEYFTTERCSWICSHFMGCLFGKEGAISNSP